MISCSGLSAFASTRRITPRFMPTCLAGECRRTPCPRRRSHQGRIQTPDPPYESSPEMSEESLAFGELGPRSEVGEDFLYRFFTRRSVILVATVVPLPTAPRRYQRASLHRHSAIHWAIPRCTLHCRRSYGLIRSDSAAHPARHGSRASPAASLLSNLELA